MKKIFLPLFMVTFAMILSGIWIFQTDAMEDVQTHLIAEYFYVGIISMLFLLGIYTGYTRMKRKKEGFPEEDEMSRKITQKAAATSFYLSLFLWLLLIYFQDWKGTESRILFGYGMIGMALIFVLSWIFYQNRGLEHE